MTEGRWKPRQRTLCEARFYHNRSLPKEPRERSNRCKSEAKFHRAFGIQQRSDQAIQRHVGLLLL